MISISTYLQSTYINYLGSIEPQEDTLDDSIGAQNSNEKIAKLESQIKDILAENIAYKADIDAILKKQIDVLKKQVEQSQKPDEIN